MQALRDFFAEKRRKILIATVVTGASYFAYQKLRNAVKSVELQQKSADFRLKSYFEDSQQACSSIVVSLIPTLYEKIANLVEIPLPAQLRNCKTKEEKLLMWEKLEIQTFTRTIAGVYSIVLMSLLLRIQINLVGRYLYRDQVEQGANSLQDYSRSEPIFDDSTQEKYLAHSDYLMQHGLEELCSRVQEASRKVLVAEWPLTRPVSFEDALQILLSIRSNLDASPAALLDCLLPPENTNDHTDDLKLNMLLGETRNILEDRDFRILFKRCVDHAFLQLIQNLRLSLVPEVEVDGSPETTTAAPTEPRNIVENINKPVVEGDTTSSNNDNNNNNNGTITNTDTSNEASAPKHDENSGTGEVNTEKGEAPNTSEPKSDGGPSADGNGEPAENGTSKSDETHTTTTTTTTTSNNNQETNPSPPNNTTTTTDKNDIQPDSTNKTDQINSTQENSTHHINSNNTTTTNEWNGKNGDRPTTPIRPKQSSENISADSLLTPPMAKMIPIIRKQFNYVLQSPYNELVEALSKFPRLQDYSYVIFSKRK